MPEPDEIRPVEDEDAEPRRTAEGDHRPRVAVEPRPQAERARPDDRGDRRIPRHREDEKPDARGAEPNERRDAEEGAAGGRDHLPAALEAEEHGPPVPEHRRRA